MGETDRFYSARFYSVTRTTPSVGDRLERWSAIVTALAAPRNRSRIERDDAAPPLPPAHAAQTTSSAPEGPVRENLLSGR